MAFENLIGNEKIKIMFTNSIKSKTISHSYLFAGPEGIGKKLFAIEFAKSILCQGQDKPCNKCKSCIEFDTLNHPDFNIINPDGDSIKIEQIRLMVSKIYEKPIISDKKIYIINDADKMTKEASNCLLKTLEEPPMFAIIILVTSNENILLTTIKSRCLIINFNKIENEELKKYLKTNFNIEIKNQELLQLFNGSLSKALELQEKKDIYEKIDRIFLNLEKQDIIDLMKNSAILYDSKEDIFNILEYINVILYNLGKNNIKYYNCITIVEQVKKNIKQNGNFDMNIDNLLLNIWEEINEKHSGR